MCVLSKAFFNIFTLKKVNNKNLKKVTKKYKS